jgi:hypothetical protein
MLREGGREISKKILLPIIIIGNIPILFYFKYFLFLFGELVDAVCSRFGLYCHLYQTSSIWLPLGTSFFTFQEITLAVDAYKGRYHKSFINYVAFITFFHT